MADFWGANGYQDDWRGATAGGGINGGGGGTAGPAEQPASDINPAGAENDPFAYTNGSLLTPWSGHFDGSKFSGGGSGVAAFKPFSYGDFSYAPQQVEGFGERYDNPGDFSYGEFTGPGDFQGVTDKDLKADKGYQFRQDRAMKILQASKAAQGILKTGGTAKALQANASDLASQEYGNVYNRKLGEHDRAVDASRFRYGTNRANAKDAFDTNVNNARQGYQIRQGAFRDNASIAQENNRFGFDVATGSYDRNFSKARQGYEDERQHAQAVASAGRANADQAYNRALSEYQMARDEFFTNQDRQYNILDREDTKGRNAAFSYAGNQTDLALQRGNAQAAGRTGSANAWANAYGNIGQGAMDAGAAYAYYRQPTSASPTRRAPSGTTYSGIPSNPYDRG